MKFQAIFLDRLFSFLIRTVDFGRIIENKTAENRIQKRKAYKISLIDML